MIIISDNTDIFSNRVENWLRLKGKAYIRINEEDPIDHFYLELTEGDFNVWLSRKFDKSLFSISNSTVWHRRGRVNFDIPFKPGEIDKQVYTFLQGESIFLSDAILMCLEAKGLLKGRNINEKGNKLFNLYKASKCGFKTPNTFVTNRKDRLQQIYLQYPKLITKPISDNFLGIVSDQKLYGYVNDFDESTFSLLPDTFFPTLFQEKVDREFEIRTFFFCGDFFSMATFLKKDDARISDIKEIERYKKRNIPYSLPDDLKNKILDLTDSLGIDTASFDFIVDKSGNTFFLELNQYGLLNEMSYSCNYMVEKFVANKLIEHGR